MKYLLDTNICIYLIKQKPPEVRRHFERLAVGDIGISSITVAELMYGVQKSQRREQNRIALEKFLFPLVVAPFNADAAAIYGNLRAALETRGTPIGALDMLIAAHALALNVTLVTNNTKEFRRVPGLKIVNWVEK